MLKVYGTLLYIYFRYIVNLINVVVPLEQYRADYGKTLQTACMKWGCLSHPPPPTHFFNSLSGTSKKELKDAECVPNFVCEML